MNEHTYPCKAMTWAELPVIGLFLPSPAQSFGGIEHAEEFAVFQSFVGHMSYLSLNSMSKYSILVNDIKQKVKEENKGYYRCQFM